MSLPHIPEPSFAWPSLCKYSDGEVEAYGQQCREAALEEAALFIEAGIFLHDQSPAKLFADQLAPKIRSLK